MSTDQPQAGAIELEPVDEAARQAAIDAFHAKAKKQAEETQKATEIKKAPPGSIHEKMVVGVVWKTTDGRTWISPELFLVRGVRKNGSRVNLKVLKKR
jgi:hypothetical protein